MRRVTVLCIGKIKGAAAYLGDGIAHYEKLLSRKVRIDWVELAETHPTATVTVEQVLAEQAEAIERYIHKHHLEDCPVVVLTEKGQTFDSEGFAAWLDALWRNPPAGGPRQRGRTDMLCIIGGAYGLAPEVRQAAMLALSLSEMTFPHQLVRLLLLEQLYRALSILDQEPYHK